MKNTSFYKKALQNFVIFLILTAIPGILLIPGYMSFYDNVREDILEKYNNKIRQEIKMIENEINLQINVVKNVSGGRDFKILSNPPAYGYNVNSVEWFESRENVQKSYSVLKSIVSLQDKSFLLFRNSDIQIDTGGAVDDFRASYDTLWRLNVDKENCSIDAATLQLFFKKHPGKFDENISYSDITNGKKYELVYLMTLSSTEDEEGNDSVFIACYDAEQLISRLSFENDIKSAVITTDNDKKIYTYGEDYSISRYDSYYQSENLNLKVHYSISDQCIGEQMRPVNFFLSIVSMFIVLFGLFATLGVTVMERRKIKKLVSLTDGITDIEYSEDDDHFKYLETILKSFYKKIINAENAVKNLTFAKLLGFKLSEEEAEFAEAYFSTSVCVLMLKNTAVKYTGMEQDVSVYLKNKNTELIHTVRISLSENVFFIKMTSAVKDVLEDMIVYLNKERHADIRGIGAVCDDVNKVPAIYERIKKDVNYLEYGSLKFVKDIEEDMGSKDFKTIISKSRQLYEIIRSGNEFEAKRIVYEEWYKITQGEVSSSNIEPLFFSQTSMLSQISAENKLNIAIPKFDSEKDAVSIAFEITECIEQICEKIKGTGKKEDVRSSQIIDYINQRYCDSSFYMPELVGKFELSDRAIVQMLKKATGDNFSNYLSKLRIDKAKEMLITTNAPISEVASASGFDSSNSLYKAFKKVYGVSPSVYRESRKNTAEQE